MRILGLLLVGLSLGGCDQQPRQALAGTIGSAAASRTRDNAARADARDNAAPGAAGRAPAAAAAPPRASDFEQPAIDARTGCPEGMAPIANYCVDRFEAHLWREQADGKLELHPAHERPLGETRFFARSRERVRPQAYISQVEAALACQNAGKRLCSAAEWYEACQGSKHTTYPYGSHFERRRCNVGKPHLLSRLHGANPGAWRYAEDFNDPRLDQEPGFLALTGEYADCASDYGVYDMVGNLHEWVGDRATADLAKVIPLKAEIRNSLRRRGGNGVFLGGFFSTTSEHGPGCRFATVAHEPTYHDYSTGFRCCRDK
ncbi:MAG TPA: SUMF1/EgtB/PvdO family nonheme iron enzyme [Polyangiaceae bacterium]|nr:SUMF1/EgtB/PvdO family nonheme iron enzyme [Polyangiaceae bacterium]